MKPETPNQPPQEQGFIKDAVVRPGVTPSVVSGRPAEMVKKGEAYCDKEPTVDRIEDLGKEF